MYQSKSLVNKLFLQKKSEVFAKFKEFKALVENQSEKKIKVFRTDNGGEFLASTSRIKIEKFNGQNFEL